jgi:hypothetical protein
MTDELVAYLLDDLCPQRRAEVERRLETDAAWRRECERLRECLAASGGDPSQCHSAGDLDEPPRDLVKKTCCLVEESGVHPQLTSVSAAAFAAAPAGECSRGSWSFSDFAVGGGVMLALSMLMFPALRESRDAARGLVCQDNLKSLGAALFDYQETHQHQLPQVLPGESAGVYAVRLAQSGVANPAELARWRMCPDSDFAEEVDAGRATTDIPTPEQINAADRKQSKQFIAWMGGSYAFILGYRDPAGRYQQLRFTMDPNVPMMADAPRIVRLGVRSASHGGCGQYVLYQDLHVPYRANSDLGANLDNIFLNLEGKHAAGCEKSDVVLCNSPFGPDGPVTKLRLVTVAEPPKQKVPVEAAEVEH